MKMQNKKTKFRRCKLSGEVGELPVRFYSPEPLLSSPLTLIRNILKDLVAGRELAWRLFIRDLAAQYRQTALGYVWAILPPLVSSFTFIYLNSQGIIKIDTGGIPYPAFAMMGTLLWQVFVDSIQCAPNALTKAKPMLAKINFPREAILVGGFYMVLFNFLIRLVLLAGVMLYWKVLPSSTIIFFPLAISTIIFCGFCIGLILSPVSALYGDIQRALPMLTGFWMLLTPVVYPARTEGLAGVIAVWNPISPIIVTARESLSGQELSLLLPFGIVTISAIIVSIFGLVGFRIAMPHIIARIGS